MHFKGLPWDFLRHHSRLSEEGIWGFYCADFYLQKLLLGRLVGGENFSALWGAEVSYDWFRDNIINDGLFSAGGKYLVYNGEGLGVEVRKAILECKSWEGGQWVLCFSKKDKFFDELSKVSGAKCLHIEPPRFWEGEKLLNFLCEQMGVPLERDVKNYLLDSMSHKSSHFIRALKFLSLNISERGRGSREEVKRLIEPRELNPFDLADLLALKKFKDFYRVLVQKRVNFDTYRSVFSFMQAHLLKLGNPGYASKKSRLSGYDRKILSSSENWSRDEIRIQLRRMGEWEICAKRRDPFLIPRLRCCLVGFS